MIYMRRWITRLNRAVITRKFRPNLKIEHYPKCIAVLPRLTDVYRAALKFIPRKQTLKKARILLLMCETFTRTIAFFENNVKEKTTKIIQTLFY